jgi:hypothetical protein
MIKTVWGRVARVAGYFNRTGLAMIALSLLGLTVAAVSGPLATITGVSRSVAFLLILGAILGLFASFPLYVLYWKLRLRRARRLHGSTPPTPNQDTGDIRPRHPTL